MKTKMPWLIAIAIVVFAGVIGAFYAEQLITKAEALPKDEIRSQLESMYGGQVDQVTLKDTIYEAELSRSNAVYLAEVDAISGKVLALSQTEKIKTHETPLTSADQEKNDGGLQTESEKTVEIETKPPSDKKIEKNPSAGTQEKKPATKKKESESVLITKKEAIQIALSQTYGEIDDVDYVKKDDGGYYLITIEIDDDDIDDDDDDDWDEVTYQIHAISGKILSVTWDD